MQRMPAPRIGIVAAEPSGDLLAAGLMKALREALPAVFIGVDAPDCNLTLEKRLREQGIATVHYVSPTVWVWRTGRVRKIRRAVDRLLTIFPFERGFLARHGIAAASVGHRLAGEYPLEPDRSGARQRLGLVENAPVLAILPGSRRAEIERLTRPFLETARCLHNELDDLQIIVPLANDTGRALFDRRHAEIGPELSLQTRLDATRDALAAADVALVASGAATFEALLSKRPMVVGYRVNAATYRLVRMLRLIRVKQVAMANLLSGEALAPELIQAECTADRWLPPLRRFFRDPAARDRMARCYAEVRSEPRMDTDRAAAEAVVALMRERGLV